MENKHPTSRLWLYFAGLIFATVFFVFLLVTLLWLLLAAPEVVEVNMVQRRVPVAFFALGSLLLGSVIAVFVGRLIIRPVQSISDAFARLSRGDFSVRVPEDARLTEIRDIARRFNAMTYDLSHMETLRSDFVANVSHEFKTPIAAIEGYATLLQSPGLSPQRHERYVEKILENSRRLSTLSGNVLLLSRLENRETVPDRAEYRLDEQLRRCLLLLEDKWAARQLELELELPNTRYCGSESLLEQVWLNLLDNAIRHTPPGGCIRLCIREEGPWLRVLVADNGEGMSEEVQKHMFEKFYQGDVSRRTEGNGLGLSLVKRIVELCRGRISVRSAPGAGTELTVSLPRET